MEVGNLIKEVMEVIDYMEEDVYLNVLNEYNFVDLSEIFNISSDCGLLMWI
ncbi:hypothetical protein GN156_39370 [bacterium LRH843]|nr:hypothetical protein [bacterium LRH843]